MWDWSSTTLMCTRTHLKGNLCWLSSEQETSVWCLESGHFPVPCALTPPAAAHGAKSTRMLGGHSLYFSQARHLRFPLPPFSRLQAEKVPVNKGEVLCYSTRVCYNPTQWCSCCLPTWMQPFRQVIAIPSARNKQASRTPSHDQEIIISLLCSQPK